MIPGFTPSESRRVRAGAFVQVGWTMIAACAGAHAVAVLLVGRLLTGIGMGVSNIAFPLFVAEVAPYTRGGCILPFCLPPRCMLCMEKNSYAWQQMTMWNTSAVPVQVAPPQLRGTLTASFQFGTNAAWSVPHRYAHVVTSVVYNKQSPRPVAASPRSVLACGCGGAAWPR